MAGTACAQPALLAGGLCIWEKADGGYRVRSTRPTCFVGEQRVLVHNCGKGGGGRTDNHFREDPKADGAPHTQFRTDKDGKVTAYETYNHPSPGEGKRVDLTGPSHGGVDTPHVVETKKHTNPNDPSKSRFTESRPRPARKDEIPR